MLGNHQSGHHQRARARRARRRSSWRHRQRAPDRHERHSPGHHRGRWTIPLSVPEDWPVRAEGEAPGFTDHARTLVLSAGSAFDISISLEVAGIDTAVTVVADSQLLETARSQIAGTVPQAEVQNLPMNGRNYLDLALLVPGVSRTVQRNTERFAETSAVPGTGISVTGQRNLNNNFIVDGLSANDDAAGLAGTYFAEDVIASSRWSPPAASRSSGAPRPASSTSSRSRAPTRCTGRGTASFATMPSTANALTGEDPLNQSQVGLSLCGPVRPRPHVLVHQRRAQRPRAHRGRQHHV